jgi:hypothetical protein
VDEEATLELRLLDAEGDVVDVQTAALELPDGGVAGPAWLEVPGKLVALADTVTHAEAALGDTVSARVARQDVALPVLLESVAYDLGLPGEPRLWWSYRNQGTEPVGVMDVLASTVLWVDGDAVRPPAAPYNGPSRLPPQRALSGWWSLDDFEGIHRQEPHRFALEILGERSEELTAGWPPA